MELGSECTIMPHVLVVIPQQFSHGKLQPLQRFSLVKHKDSLTACDQTITDMHSRTANTNMHRAYHYWHSHPSSFSPLRFPYSLLAFCGNFQLFGSSQENSHKSAKVPRSGIVFNLEGEKKENLSAALHKPQKHNLIAWHANKKQKFIFLSQVWKSWVTPRYWPVKQQQHMKHVCTKGNVLRILARGITASSSNLESPLF